MDDAKILLMCRCEDPSHQMIIRYCLDEDSQRPVVWGEVLLNREYNIIKRIANAVRYVLGGKECRYGNFNEIIFSEEHAATFARIAQLLRPARYS